MIDIDIWPSLSPGDRIYSVMYDCDNLFWRVIKSSITSLEKKLNDAPRSSKKYKYLIHTKSSCYNLRTIFDPSEKNIFLDAEDAGKEAIIQNIKSDNLIPQLAARCNSTSLENVWDAGGTSSGSLTSVYIIACSPLGLPLWNNDWPRLSRLKSVQRICNIDVYSFRADRDKRSSFFDLLISALLAPDEEKSDLLILANRQVCALFDINTYELTFAEINKSDGTYLAGVPILFVNKIPQSEARVLSGGSGG